MKFEIRWIKNDKPVARRMDRAPMTDEDRQEVRDLVRKMLRHEVCWNCGTEWTKTTDINGNLVKVCWTCAITV